MPFPPVRCSILLLVGLSLSATGARAAEHAARLDGTTFSVADPCARRVTIDVDPALHRQVAVSASAEHQEELDRLRLQGGAVARIDAAAECWRPAGTGSFSPTLLLSVRVPAGFAVAVAEPGSGHYALGAIGGALDLDLSGAVTMTAERATTLKARLSGSGTVTVAQADGAASIDLSGDGQVMLRRVALPSLDVSLGGAGDVAIAAGRIDRATLRLSGAGSIGIGATLGDVDATLSGVGSVHLDRVTGRLDKQVSGVGRVIVGTGPG